MKNRLILIILAVLAASVAAHAQLWQNILNPIGTAPCSGATPFACAIDWSTAGVPGGIPNYSVCSTLNAASGDQTANIQNALNAAANSCAVLLGAGTFRTNSLIVIPANKVLRGTLSSGLQTIIDCQGGGTAQQCISYGNNRDDSQVPLANGSSTSFSNASAGATSITVGSTTGLSLNENLMLTQQNLSYMTETGSNGTCNFCNYGFTGMGDSGQTVQITGIAGNVVSISPALYIAYSSSPRAFYYANAVTTKSAGLEYVKLKGNNTGYKEMILMQGCQGCWAKGVEVDFADNAHMFMYNDLNSEVRDSYFHDGFNHGSGTTDNQLNLAYWSSNNLVVNTIFYRMHACTMFQRGSSGNVLFADYCDGGYHDAQLTFMDSGFNTNHGTFPMLNLIDHGVSQGNCVDDDQWGSSGYLTLFRIWCTGSRKYIPPQNARGALQPGSFQWEDQGSSFGNTFGIELSAFAYSVNVVGDITGSPHLLAAPASSQKVSPNNSPANSFKNNVCLRIGYDNTNDALGPTSGFFSGNLTNQTLFLHGFPDCNTGTVTWSGSVTHTLPPSFYTSAKPTRWWGNRPWPAIGPDVAGGPGQGGFAYNIPSQDCFNTTTNNNTTNSSVFDPVGCYGSGAPSAGGAAAVL